MRRFVADTKADWGNMSEQDYFFRKTMQVLQEVKKTIVGKDEILCKVMMALLAKGHILIEDIPGVGKTTMALAFAQALGLKCNRMQFTPDVMPSDIVGFNMYNRATNQFEYKQGAVACNIFLADEINRTSPKTQSALLQVMEEGAVTVDGVTRKVPEPFIVMATQNPYGSVGTQKLPESQLDRFMIRLTLGYPSVQNEVEILKERQQSTLRVKSRKVIEAEEFLQLREVVENIYVDDSIYEYVAQLAKETRSREDIVMGISPRGSLAVIGMAKARAFLREHEYVLPSDVQYVLFDTMAHRLVLSHSLHRSHITEKSVIQSVVNKVQAPQIIAPQVQI